MILTAGAVGSNLMNYISRVETYKRLSRLLMIASFATVTFAFLLMVFYFLSSDMTIAYVHANSKMEYPWYYKLAGAWAGDDGSILFWTWLLSLVTLLFSFGRKNDSPGRARLRSLSTIYLHIFLAAMIVLLITADPFRATPPMFLVTQGEMTGRGMSPLLLTPLVIVHPPMEFAAFALIAVPFATALAHLSLGRSQWTRISMQWTRMAWFFLTMAMVIGALWAYIVLGWGGYWAWDPVETSNLVIWLPLTALVHSQLWNRRKGQFSHISPVLAGLAFAFTMLGTFETRTGVIVSVHSFSSPVGGIIANDLGARVLMVLKAGGAIPLFFMYMVVSLLITAALVMFYFIRLRLREDVVSRRIIVVGVAFLVIYTLAALWAVFDVEGLTKMMLDVSNAMSFGISSLGLMILAGIFIGIPLLWMIATSPMEDDPPKRLSDWISDDSIVNLALALFFLWTIVTIAIMIIGANALNPAEFESRLPFLLIPVGLMLFTGLTWRFFSKTWTPYALVILGFIIFLSFALFSSNFGALYFPLVLAIIFATGLRLYKTWAPGVLSFRLRIAAMLIFVSYILSFVMWSAGLIAIDVIVFAIHPTLEQAILLSTLSLAGLIILAYAISTRDARLWIGATLLSFALLGFVIGAVLSVIALVIILTSLMDLRPATGYRKASFTSIIRGASPQLIHLGVALLVLGYASSNYFAAEHLVTAPRGLTVTSFSGYQFNLTGSSGVDTDGDGLYERIIADVNVVKDGSPLFTMPLTLIWRTEAVNVPHYLPDPQIRSSPTSDLYFTFSSFAAGGTIYSINDESGLKSNSTALDSAVFIVRENPGMASLWGGAWLMAMGMVIRVWSERKLYGPDRTDPFEETWVVRPKIETAERPETREVDDNYRKLLEEELRKEDESE